MYFYTWPTAELVSRTFYVIVVSQNILKPLITGRQLFDQKEKYGEILWVKDFIRICKA